MPLKESLAFTKKLVDIWERSDDMDHEGAYSAVMREIRSAIIQLQNKYGGVPELLASYTLLHLVYLTKLFYNHRRKGEKIRIFVLQYTTNARG